MRVLIFQGEIDTLNDFADNAKAFLDKIGCEALLCKLPLGKDTKRMMEEFLKKRVHVAIMYDGIGMCFKEIFDQLGIVVVNILVDHPMTFEHCMESPPQRYIQFSPDENHVEFSRKYWGIENSFFLPHMGTAPVVCGEDRDIKLLFAGTCFCFDELISNIESIQVPGFRDVCFQMIDYMLMDSSMTIEKACDIVLKDKGIDVSPKEFARIMIWMKNVDEYVRMCYRDRVLRTILDTGLDITVIGVNWDKSNLLSYTNFHWLPPMAAKKVFQYMRQSKLVLNVMPWFKAGSHERIFNTLLSGACPVSDKSRWLEEKFKDKQDIAFYDLNELEALPGLIEQLLQNDAMREEIIRNGQEKVLRHYTTESVIGEALHKVIDIYYP